jgi:hypothetical protein
MVIPDAAKKVKGPGAFFSAGAPPRRIKQAASGLRTVKTRQ